MAWRPSARNNHESKQREQREQWARDDMRQNPRQGRWTRPQAVNEQNYNGRFSRENLYQQHPHQGQQRRWGQQRYGPNQRYQGSAGHQQYQQYQQHQGLRHMHVSHPRPSMATHPRYEPHGVHMQRGARARNEADFRINKNNIDFHVAQLWDWSRQPNITNNPNKYPFQMRTRDLTDFDKCDPRCFNMNTEVAIDTDDAKSDDTRTRTHNGREHVKMSGSNVVPHFDRQIKFHMIFKGTIPQIALNIQRWYLRFANLKSHRPNYVTIVKFEQHSSSRGLHAEAREGDPSDTSMARYKYGVVNFFNTLYYLTRTSNGQNGKEFPSPSHWKLKLFNDFKDAIDNFARSLHFIAASGEIDLRNKKMETLSDDMAKFGFNKFDILEAALTGSFGSDTDYKHNDEETAKLYQFESNIDTLASLVKDAGYTYSPDYLWFVRKLPNNNLNHLQEALVETWDLSKRVSELYDSQAAVGFSIDHRYFDETHGQVSMDSGRNGKNEDISKAKREVTTLVMDGQCEGPIHITSDGDEKFDVTKDGTECESTTYGMGDEEDVIVSNLRDTMGRSSVALNKENVGKNGENGENGEEGDKGDKGDNCIQGEVAAEIESKHAQELPEGVSVDDYEKGFVKDSDVTPVVFLGFHKKLHKNPFLLMKLFAKVCAKMQNVQYNTEILETRVDHYISCEIKQIKNAMNDILRLLPNRQERMFWWHIVCRKDKYLRGLRAPAPNYRRDGSLWTVSGKSVLPRLFKNFEESYRAAQIPYLDDLDRAAADDQMASLSEEMRSLALDA